MADKSQAEVATLEFASKGKKNDRAFATIPFKSIVIVKGFNPRKNFDPEQLAALAATIKSTGLKDPLGVRPMDGGKYALVDGERRYKALKMNEFDGVVPVIVKTGDADPTDDLIDALKGTGDANVPLSLEELAAGIARLTEDGLKANQIATRTGIHPKTIQRAQKIASKAVPDVLKRLKEDNLSQAAAMELSGYEPATQTAVLKEIDAGKGGATTDSIRELAKKLAKGQVKDLTDEGDDDTDKTKKKGTGKSAAAKKKDKTKKIATMTVWRKATIKNDQIGQLAYLLTGTDSLDEVKPHAEVLVGALAYALWDRGELETPSLPIFFPNNGEWSDKPKEKVGMSVDRVAELAELIHAEAKRFKAEMDEADDTGGEEAEVPAKGKGKKKVKATKKSDKKSKSDDGEEPVDLTGDDDDVPEDDGDEDDADDE